MFPQIHTRALTHALARTQTHTHLLILNTHTCVYQGCQLSRCLARSRWLSKLQPIKKKHVIQPIAKNLADYLKQNQSQNYNFPDSLKLHYVKYINVSMRSQNYEFFSFSILPARHLDEQITTTIKLWVGNVRCRLCLVP